MQSPKGLMRWAALAGILLAVAALDSQRMIPGPPQARALENPVEARQEMVAELQKVVDRLDRLIGLLESGKVKVSLSNAEELKGVLSAAPAAGDKGDGEPKITIRRKGE